MITWAVALSALALAALSAVALLRRRPPSRRLLRLARVPLVAPRAFALPPPSELALPPRTRVDARRHVPPLDPVAPAVVDLALLGVHDDRAEVDRALWCRVKERLSERDCRRKG